MDTHTNSRTLVRPTLSYIIWFTQRTGSSLLSRALESTGVAGVPGEWLNSPVGEDPLTHFGVGTSAELRRRLYGLGSTPNGVCGLKYSFREPHFGELVKILRALPGCEVPGCEEGVARAEVWARAFPNGKHLFSTRRNKVRLAVSWWKAIKSGEWHRENGQPPRARDVADAYDFNAINHLFSECSMREAGIQAFYGEAGITPLTVVYEDFVADYAATVERVLEYLELERPDARALPEPYYAPLADEVSEAWVQRFREERQAGWTNRGW